MDHIYDANLGYKIIKKINQQLLKKNDLYFKERTQAMIYNTLHYDCVHFYLLSNKINFKSILMGNKLKMKSFLCKTIF